MVLARVIGPVVATHRHPGFAHYTLLLCQPVDENGANVGGRLIAVDHAQAGQGDLVLLLREGGGVRQVLQQPNAPIRTVIAAIVDEVSTA